MSEVDQTEHAEDERQPDSSKREVVAGDDSVERHLPELPPPFYAAEHQGGRDKHADQGRPRMLTQTPYDPVSRRFGG